MHKIGLPGRPSVVVVIGTKIAFYVSQSVAIGQNWFMRASNCSKGLTSATNLSACLWFIDHTHSIGATTHARAWRQVTIIARTGNFTEHGAVLLVLRISEKRESVLLKLSATRS